MKWTLSSIRPPRTSISPQSMLQSRNRMRSIARSPCIMAQMTGWFSRSLWSKICSYPICSSERSLSASRSSTTPWSRTTISWKLRMRIWETGFSWWPRTKGTRLTTKLIFQCLILSRSSTTVARLVLWSQLSASSLLTYLAWRKRIEIYTKGSKAKVWQLLSMARLLPQLTILRNIKLWLYSIL